MPSSRNSHSRQTAFSSDVLFRNSSTTTDIWHVYLLLAGRRDIWDNYATFIFLQQMIIPQEEESDRRLQHEQNKLALLREFAKASFQEACTGGLDTILQPMIHLREERNHCHHHRTGWSPPMIPSDSSSLPSPIQWSRQQPDIISQSSNNSGPSIPRAPLGSLHNPIVIEEDDSDNETRTPADNTWCPRCPLYVHNSYHSEDYCNTIFVPGAPAMICRWCGLLLSSEFGRRCRVRSRARHWLQLVSCAALLLDALNFGGPDGVGESGVELRRSLRKTRAS